MQAGLGLGLALGNKALSADRETGSRPEAAVWYTGTVLMVLTGLLLLLLLVWSLVAGTRAKRVQADLSAPPVAASFRRLIWISVVFANGAACLYVMISHDTVVSDGVATLVYLASQALQFIIVAGTAHLGYHLHPRIQ